MLISCVFFFFFFFFFLEALSPWTAGEKSGLEWAEAPACAEEVSISQYAKMQDGVDEKGRALSLGQLRRLADQGDSDGASRY